MARPLSLIVRSSLAVLAVGSLASAAEAGVFRASGGVRVSGGFNARVHTGWRPTFRPRVWVGSYQPRYYYPYYQPVPAYYTTVDTIAAPGVTQVAVVASPLPRLGLGLFAGGLVTTNGETDGFTDVAGTNFGLLGRFRLTHGLVLEGELSKTNAYTSVSNDVDFTRVDRRLGAALVYEFGAHNRWSPYIVGGLGVEKTDLGQWSSEGGYGEIGGGIRFAVTRQFHLTAELRGGARDAPGTSYDRPVPLAERTIYPVPDPTSDPQTETYVRSRFAAILWF